MTQLTRKSTIHTGRIGHYELKGYIGLKHNYEFASMAYGGTLGLSPRRGSELEKVDMGNVQDAYRLLCEHCPLLLVYLTDLKKAESVVEYHVKENDKYVRLNDNWRDHIMMPNESVSPLAAANELNELIIGKRERQEQKRIRVYCLFYLVSLR